VGIKLIVATCVIIIMTGLVVLPTNAALPRADSETAVSERTATALYAKHCASCHGKDGRSKTLKAKFNKARNLTESGWQEAVSDERIYNSIANGRGSKMPGFAKKMSEAEIDALVLLVRGLRQS
jgi:mono/diheme cytochrome c family protein